MAAMTPDDLAVHADFLRRLAQRLLASPDLADDAVQETLVLAWRKQPDVEKPRGWLTQVLRNVVRNQRRGEARRVDREEHVAPARTSHTPEAILAREETRKRLLDATLALPETEREVVLLRYGQGLPPREVASELGLPIHTVHNRLRSGLARMRADLDEAYGGDGQGWRGALTILLPSLPSKSASAGLGGLLMGKKLVAVAALCLIAFATWFWFGSPLDLARNDGGGEPRGLSADIDTDDHAGPALQPHATSNAPTAATRAPITKRLFGRVLDQKTNAPVAGARVVAFDYERLADVTTTTDAEGNFELPDSLERHGAYHLVVTHPGHAPNVVPGVQATADGLTLVRREGGWIEGRLLDEDGAPVRAYRVSALRRLQQPGAEFDLDRVTAFGLLPQGLTVDRSAEITDAAGAFRLGPLRPGIHVLAFEVAGAPPLFEAQGAAYYERAKGIAVRANETTALGDVPWPGLGHIDLKVVDADSEEVLEEVAFTAAIHIDGRHYSTPVGVTERTATGAYRIPVALNAQGTIGNTLLRATKPGYSPHALSVSGQASGLKLTMRLDRPATLHATILDAAGAPITGATAILRRDANGVSLDRVALDAQGRFVARELPAGAPLAVVLLDNATLAILRVYPIKLEPGEDRTVVWGGPNQTAIQGVLRHAGQPIHRALISLDTPGGRRTQVWTSRTGAFRFDGLSPGVHAIAFSLDTPQVFLERTVALTEGKLFEIPIDLDYRLAGTTDWRNPKKDDDGLGNPTLLARLVEDEGFTVSTKLANDGSFTLVVPAAATYTIESAFSGHLVLGAPQAVASKDGPKLHLRLFKDPGDGHVTIRVVEAETGADVPDASFKYRYRTTRGGGVPWKGIVEDGRLSLGRHRYIFRSPVHIDLPLEFDITREEKRVERTVKLVRADAIEVVGFTPTSRAKVAGLVLGDHLLSYAGTRVHNVPELVAAIRRTDTTDAVSIEVLRMGRRHKLDVPGGRMGVRLANRCVKE